MRLTEMEFRRLRTRLARKGSPRARASRRKPERPADRMSEDQIQRSIMQLLDAKGEPGHVAWHTPNGGGRSRIEASIFKSLGVRAGIPDILILLGGHLYGLELKAARGTLSARQKRMLERLQAAGATVAVAFGVDEAERKLREWGVLR